MIIVAKGAQLAMKEVLTNGRVVEDTVIITFASTRKGRSILRMLDSFDAF